MVNIIKIDDKNFDVIENGATTCVPATCKAIGSGNGVRILDVYNAENPSFSRYILLQDLQINGEPQSSVADATQALNAFIGNFRAGGVTPPTPPQPPIPTEYPHVEGATLMLLGTNNVGNGYNPFNVSTWKDLVGDNDGEIVDGVWDDRALVMNGTSSMVKIKGDITPSFTQHFYLKRDAIQGAHPRIMAEDPYPSPYVQTGTMRYSWISMSADGQFLPHKVMPADTWVVLSYTHEAGSGKVLFYENGIYAGEISTSSAPVSVPTATIAGRLQLPTRYIRARYRSIILYDFALTPAQVKQNYEADVHLFNTDTDNGINFYEEGKDYTKGTALMGSDLQIYVAQHDFTSTTFEEDIENGNLDFSVRLSALAGQILNYSGVLGFTYNTNLSDTGLNLTMTGIAPNTNGVLVRWGDGTEERFTTTSPSHTYAAHGIYGVTVNPILATDKLNIGVGAGIAEVVMPYGNNTLIAANATVVHVPQGITSIPAGFLGTAAQSRGVTEVAIPDSALTVAPPFIADGQSLEHLTFSKGVASITVASGTYFVANAPRLRTLDLSELRTLAAANNYTFTNLISLRKLDLCNLQSLTITGASNGVMSNLWTLTELCLDNLQVLNVGSNGVFGGVHSLKRLNLPKLQMLYQTVNTGAVYHAFHNAYMLEQMTLSNALTTVAGMINFCKGATNLQRITFIDSETGEELGDDEMLLPTGFAFFTRGASREDMVYMFNKVKDLGDTPTRIVYILTAIYNLLTADDRLILTNKGYTITTFNQV